MPDVTTLLQSYWDDPVSREEVHRRVVAELHRRAEACLRGAGPHTLEPAALVSEAFLKIFKGATIPWKDRNHFFAFMFSAMKQVLIDHARKKNAQKRKRDVPHFEVREDDRVADDDLEAAILIADVLEKLSQESPLTARIVGLLYCEQRTFAEIAELLRAHEGLTLTAQDVERHWQLAQARIYQVVMGKK